MASENHGLRWSTFLSTFVCRILSDFTLKVVQEGLGGHLGALRGSWVFLRRSGGGPGWFQGCPGASWGSLGGSVVAISKRSWRASCGKIISRLFLGQFWERKGGQKESIVEGKTEPKSIQKRDQN